jgi:PAS domain-containing protein
MSNFCAIVGISVGIVMCFQYNEAVPKTFIITFMTIFSILSPANLTTLLFIYWIPACILTLYSAYEKNWIFTAAGLMLSLSGSVVLWLFIKKLEQLIQKKYEDKIEPPKADEQHPPVNLVEETKIKSLETALDDYEKQLSDLNEDRENKKCELAALSEENRKQRQTIEGQRKQAEDLKNEMHRQSMEHQNLFNAQQSTIAEQREAIQSKQQLIAQLESKVRDLSYEIKTILQIAEAPPEPNNSAIVSKTTLLKKEPRADSSSSNNQIQSFEEASILLKRCLDETQKITSTPYFAKNQRFKDLPIENYTLDLRRLFDHFQNESEGIVFIFSPKDDKMLFINDQITRLTGIEPEKFLKTFPEIIQGCRKDWELAIDQLSLKNDSKITFPIKMRASQEIQLHCVIKIIPAGIFRNHVLGVLFSDTKSLITAN